MNDMDYRMILGELVEIKKRLDSIEQASPSRANSEQSVVSPPNVVDSENPALARPATIPEIVSILKFMLTEEGLPVNCVDVRWGWSKAVQFVLKRIKGRLIIVPQRENHKSVKDYIDSLTVY